MALIVPVYVNDTLIGSLTAVRKSGGMDKDSINDYEIEVVENAERFNPGRYSFSLQHRYGDNAFVLIRKAIEEFEEVKKSRVL